MIYIGTCSWKYSSWEGLVYDTFDSADWLTQYARHYNSVEVDQWFWSLGKQSYALPQRAVVEQYDRATGPDFTFTIKCPNTITLPSAYGRKDEPNPWFLDPEVFYRFLDSLGPLVEKTGLFMFQFGYLNQQAVQSREQFEQSISAFFSILPDTLPYAIELRNPKWLDSSWFQLLARKSIAPVLISGYWMEDLSSALSYFEATDGNTLCIRLHGDDRSGIEQQTGNTWNKLVGNRDEEIASIAPTLVRLAKQGRIIFVNVNNHYEGSAPLTIDKLLPYLESVYEGPKPW